MSDLHYAAAFVIALLSAARITRLLVFDAFPPSAWLRAKWDDRTEGSGWNLLLHCPWCLSFWATLATLGSGWACDWHSAWWFVNAVFAGSYLASSYIANDGDE